MRALALAAIALAAGCLEASPPAGDERDTWILSGSFTTERTQADIDAVCAAVREHNPECAIMESFPEQFAFRFPSRAACADAEARVTAVPHVRTSGCRQAPTPSTSPETPTSTSVAPTPGPGARELDVKTFALTWSNGEPDGRESEMEWEVVRAWEEDGLVTIETTTHGIEGGDFRFTLAYRPGAPGEALVHEEGAARAGTFDFRYQEAIFWAGRPVDRVERVEPYSEIALEGEARGTFHLDFVGRCAAGPDCPEPQAERRVVLDGRFGP